jgi:hypothetical protein
MTRRSVVGETKRQRKIGLAFIRLVALRSARRINSQESLVRSAVETPDMEG